MDRTETCMSLIAILLIVVLVFITVFSVYFNQVETAPVFENGELVKSKLSNQNYIVIDNDYRQANNMRFILVMKENDSKNDYPEKMFEKVKKENKKQIGFKFEDKEKQ